MASTALHTFILRADSSVFSVEIKGSWDNFSKAYSLKKDRPTGQWRGCHTFRNITCDGDPAQPTESRDGGLKMGGTYWYFTVNILEVPIQSKPELTASPRSSMDSLHVFTLDPQDKYLPQGAHRAASTSAIKSRKNSIATILTQKSVPKTPSTIINGRESCTRSRPRSLASIFDGIRQTRSAGSSTKSGLSWPRKILSRSGSRAGASAADAPTDNIPPVPRLPCWVPAESPASKEELNLPIQRGCIADSTAKPKAGPANDVVESVIVPWPAEEPSYTIPLVSRSQSPQAVPDQGISADRTSNASPSTDFVTSLEQLKESNAFFAELSSSESRENLTSAIPNHAGPTIGMRRGFGNQALYWEKRASEASSESKIFDAEPVDPYTSYTESSTYSYGDDDSPYLTTNTTQSGPMSPLHLSQPETPIKGDFEDRYSSPLRHDLSSSLAELNLNDHGQAMKAPSRPAPPPPSAGNPPSLPTESEPSTLFPASGFHGYSLPDSDHASVLTIRKMPSANLKSTDAASPFAPQDKQDMVHSWNDGNPHRLSALGELMEDMGYLGDLIS
ncbi:hypothetical protein P7C71_g5928, partial [Lecanoromycetidae sp. Uapishka_2]